MKKIALYTVLSFVLASPVFAATSPGATTDDLNCISQPTCADLGYEAANALSACSGGSWISCPFDETYKKCIPNNSGSAEKEIDCAVLGFTKADKTSWCKDVVTCPADATYTLCKSAITCASGETLIGGSCEIVYSSCAAANLMSSAECNKEGWSCALPTTIYTSSAGDTTICYRSKLAKLCPSGYATSKLGCGISAITGESCDKGYLFLELLNPTDYSGDTPCGRCTCALDIGNGGYDDGGLDPVLPADCCSRGYKYNVDGTCTNTCPYTDGRMCITCATSQISPL